MDSLNTETQIQNQATPIKKHLTLYQKVKNRLNITKLIFGILSMVAYTIFTVVMLSKNWGSTVYMGIVMGFVGVYILLFIIIIILTVKSGKKVSRSFKDYKSGLKILSNLLRLINFGLSVSIFTHASYSDIGSTFFQITVLIFTMTWALFQIVYQVTRMLKRHEIIGKNKKKKK